MGGEGLGFGAIGNTVADRATPSIFHVKASCPRRADLCLVYVQPLGN
jgi:phosphoglycerate dehydrogenase-like enzyme